MPREDVTSKNCQSSVSFLLRTVSNCLRPLEEMSSKKMSIISLITIPDWPNCFWRNTLYQSDSQFSSQVTELITPKNKLPWFLDFCESKSRRNSAWTREVLIGQIVLRLPNRTDEKRDQSKGNGQIIKESFELFGKTPDQPSTKLDLP